MKHLFTFILLTVGFSQLFFAQTYPVDAEGSGQVFLRAHSLAPSFGTSGIELINGEGGGVLSGDWRISNVGGSLNFISNNDNFSGDGDIRLNISRLGNIGIGVAIPQTRLHIDDGEDASLTGDGYLIIGDKSGINMVFDENEINTRNNGLTSALYLQNHGGNLYTGLNGGNTYLANGGGKVGIGSTVVNAKFNISDDDFQLYMRNAGSGVQDWYMGVSNNSWAIGGNRLVFSPSSSSSDAIMALHDISDNNGTVAPVIIYSGGGQRLLMDGNEIDANSPLYINHNSDENTYINASGGKASVGSSNPWGQFHVEYTGSSTTAQCLTLETPRCAWGITPSNTATNANLFFMPGGTTDAIAGINSVNGGWLSFSDRRVKHNIKQLPAVLNKVNKINLYSYTYKHDKTNTPNIGVIAQELQTEFPELVGEIENHLGVNYGQLSVVALKAIQELDAENKILHAQLQKQQEQIDILLQKMNK